MKNLLPLSLKYLLICSILLVYMYPTSCCCCIYSPLLHGWMPSLSHSGSHTTSWAAPLAPTHTPNLTQISPSPSQAPTTPYQGTGKAAPPLGSFHHSALAPPTPATPAQGHCPRSASALTCCTTHLPHMCLARLAEAQIPLSRRLPAQILSIPCSSVGSSGLHQTVTDSTLPLDALLTPRGL